MLVLELKNVSKKIKRKMIIDQISFRIDKGEICGFVGPNGSGKTTFIRMLTGLIRPTAGFIKINNENIVTHREAALINVGAIVENPIFFPYMSGRKNLINLGRITPTIREKELHRKVDEVLEKVGLEKRADDKVSTYSLGMKQRLGIAQALLGDPQIVILDEPTNGLDPMGIRMFRNIVKELNEQQNISFFISSHSLLELDKICSSWVFIHNGQLIWRGTSKQLKTNSNNVEDLFMELMDAKKVGLT